MPCNGGLSGEGGGAEDRPAGAPGLQVGEDGAGGEGEESQQGQAGHQAGQQVL